MGLSRAETPHADFVVDHDFSPRANPTPEASETFVPKVFRDHESEVGTGKARANSERQLVVVELAGLAMPSPAGGLAGGGVVEETESFELSVHLVEAGVEVSLTHGLVGVCVGFVGGDEVLGVHGPPKAWEGVGSTNAGAREGEGVELPSAALGLLGGWGGPATGSSVRHDEGVKAAPPAPRTPILCAGALGGRGVRPPLRGGLLAHGLLLEGRGPVGGAGAPLSYARLVPDRA